MYMPDEDTWLLASVLKKEKPFGTGLAIDAGTGSGYIGRLLESMGWRVVATDVQNVKPEGLTFVRCFSASCLKRRFSLGAFNLPYLSPSTHEYVNREELESTPEEMEKMISSLMDALVPDGRAYFVFSSLGPSALDIARGLGFKAEIRARKRLFFEELFVVGVDLTE